MMPLISAVNGGRFTLSTQLIKQNCCVIPLPNTAPQFLQKFSPFSSFARFRAERFGMSSLLFLQFFLHSGLSMVNQQNNQRKLTEWNGWGRDGRETVGLTDLVYHPGVIHIWNKISVKMLSSSTSLQHFASVFFSFFQATTCEPTNPNLWCGHQ